MLNYNKFSSYFTNILKQNLDLLAEFGFKPEVYLLASQW